MLAGAACFVLCCTYCFADTLFLNSGEKVNGLIVEQNDDLIRMNVDGALLTYWSDEVERIRVDQPVEEEAVTTKESEDPQVLAKDQTEKFTVYINGMPLKSSMTISPQAPIMARFYHPNPAVTHVIMRHPNDPNRKMAFAIDATPRIKNHEGHMRANHDSSSEFVAVDANGNVYDSIRVTFRP